MVDGILRKSAEEARNQLPDLLEAAEKGHSTIITRHGRPVAALVPIGAYGAAVRQQSLLSVAGSGRGLWGKNSTRTLQKLRGRMEQLDFGDLPEGALVLLDSAPIIYFLEGHPKLGVRFKPLFEAHAAGRLRFAATTLTIAEVLSGPLRLADDALARR